MTDNQPFVLPNQKTQGEREAPALCQVSRIKENKIEKKAEGEKRKAQNDQVIQAIIGIGGGIGARTVEDTSQSHPNEEVTDKDREREDRIGARGLLEGGFLLDREREDRRESRGLLEGKGLSQRRDLFLQPCPCPRHRHLKESVRSREMLPTLHLICEVS